METVTKTACDPDTKQEYEIELPANSVVEGALLKIDFRPGGLNRDDVVKILAERFSLTDEQRNAKNKAGQRVFNRHVGNVARPLINSEKLVVPKDWYIDINREQISGQARAIKKDFDDSEILEILPEESIEKNYHKIRDGLAEELLQEIKKNTPTFFEELVIDLLVAMGYGGSREDAQAVGRSGDGGIDGIINEDRLGLDVIYVQAKRWENNVSEPPVRDFVGALQGKRARKGIFITTSGFTNRAREYISAIDSRDSKVILIDGNQLAQLMMEHDIGVSTTKTYEIKRVDSDYFAENAE